MTDQIVELKLDEENSLMFEVSIEGDTGVAPVYRLVCEGENISYSFKGDPAGNSVEFVVPALQNKVKEGTYDSHLEVIIDNKLLIPLEFKTNFVIPTKVFVESVKVESKTKATQPVTAAAKLLKVSDKPVAAKKTEAPKPVVEKKQREEKKQVTLRELYQRKNRESK